MEQVQSTPLLPPRLDRVQRNRKLAIAALVAILMPALAVTATRWPDGSLPDTGIEFVGTLMIFACILGRAACTLYIGGRKCEQLIACGLYSLCRNPLYFFSGIGAFGAGLSTGSVTIGFILAALFVMVFQTVILREERFLLSKFGDTYRAYMARTPRWIPRLSAWTVNEPLNVNPKTVLRTVRDACWFLLVLPVSELLEQMQQMHLIPVFLHLP